MLLLSLKMKNTSFFLSNEPYSTFRGQKLTKVEGFKAHTTKIRVSSEFLSAFVPSVLSKIIVEMRIILPFFFL